MIGICIAVLILMDYGVVAGRRHFGGASSSSSSEPWPSDYSNSTRIIDDGDAIIVIPVPVMNRPITKQGKDKNVIRTNPLEKQWIRNQKLIDGRALYKNDSRYYPCPLPFVKSHWSTLSYHLDTAIHPYLPSGVNVTFICIKEKSYTLTDFEYWKKDNLAMKFLIGFWIIVLIFVLFYAIAKCDNRTFFLCQS